jgi:putative ABC transport system permease protein
MNRKTLRALLRRDKFEDGLDAELRHHIELRAADLTRSGLSPEAAERQARLELGSRERYKDEARAAFGLRWLDDLGHDLRYAVRTLSRKPGFLAAVVLTLALGIGANTAVYTIVDATLLRPLPYPHPGRLVKLSLIRPATPTRPSSDDALWSYPKYETFRDSQNVFDDVASYDSTTATLTGIGDPEVLRGEIVSGNYFSLLGARAELGRTFTVNEDAVIDRDYVTVLSHALWARRFGSDPSVIGRTIRLDRTYTVIGVLPSDFQGLSGPADLWIPAHAVPSSQELGDSRMHSRSVAARLKPGVSMEQARAATAQAGEIVNKTFPDPRKLPWGAIARSLDETRVDPVIRRSMLALFAAVGLVLLIGCVNVANLLLAQGTVRQREIAIRAAIGAGQGRVLRQLITESLLLSLTGGAAGLLLAAALVKAFDSVQIAGATLGLGRAIAGLTLHGFSSVRLDGAALLFAASISILTGLLFGILPAWDTSKASLTGALKSSSSSLGSRVRLSSLVVVEGSLALVLLVGANLTVQSFLRLSKTDTGVDPTNVLTARITLARPPASPQAAARFFGDLEAKTAGLPGVRVAGLSTCTPLSGTGCTSTNVSTPGDPDTPVRSGIYMVSTGYFSAVRIPLLQGRLFDTSDSHPVAIVNQTAARKLWPGQRPLGKMLRVPPLEGEHEIVGVVGDVRYEELDQPSRPDVYVDYTQNSSPRMFLYARTEANPTALLPLLREQLRQLDPNQPLDDVQTMEQRAARAVMRPRYTALVLGAFAGVAALLAGIGLYSVTAYTVRQKTREIGIRVALGATRSRILTGVLQQGLILIAAGTVGGIVLALGASRLLTGLLYQTEPADPTILTLSAITFLLVGLAACVIPARRAATVDPIQALRSE